MFTSILEALLLGVLPCTIIALVAAYLCDNSKYVFLGIFAIGFCVITASGLFASSWIVIPILLIVYMIWSVAFKGGAEA